MRVAIMQPYMFPYIGYFQLMNNVDRFVVYDNIEYTKKGWINRNRILLQGTDALISIPLKKDSDYLEIRERRLSESWPDERFKFLNRIRESYRKAEFFAEAFPVISDAVMYDDRNLFEFLRNSLGVIKDYLKIVTPLVKSSSIPIDHSLKAQDRVIEICRAMNATEYINPIGGLELYDRDTFRKAGINLQFLRTRNFDYDQFGQEFVPNLSVVDVMMFNSPDRISSALVREFDLI